MLVDEQRQMLLVVGGDVEKKGGALPGPEAQGDVFSPQCDLAVDGRGQGTGVPALLIRLPEGVAG